MNSNSKAPIRIGGYTVQDVKLAFTPSAKSLRFAVRTTFAALLSYFIAKFLGFHEAYWAMVTSWILAIPGRGLIFSKALYRFAGTLIGACAAYVMLPFADKPEFFFLMLSVWIGVCAFAARMFRRMETYTAQLAGYTATLIATVGLASHTDATQYFAEERVVLVLLGIVVSSVIGWLFAEPTDEKELFNQIRNLVHKTVSHAAQGLSTNFNRELWLSVSEFESSTSYAAIESSTIRSRLPAIKRLTALQISLISSVRAIRKIGVHYKLNDEFLKTELQNAGDCLLRGEEPTEQIRVIRERADNLLNSTDHKDIYRLMVYERASEIVEILESMSKELLSFHTPSNFNKPAKTAIHRDYLACFGNGLRAFFATFFIGMLWYKTQWSGGGYAFVFTSVVITLFGVVPQPLVSVTRFGLGISSVVVAFVLWHLLPAAITQSFPITVIIVILTTFFGAIGIYHRFAPMMEYNVNFSALMLSSGTAIVGGLAALKMTLGLITGVTIAFIFFAIPTMSWRQRERWARKNYRSYLRKIASGRLEMTPLVWETRVYDFIVQSRLTVKSTPESLAFLKECFDVMDLGLELIRLRAIYKTLPSDHKISLFLVSAFMNMGQNLTPEVLQMNLRLVAKNLIKCAEEAEEAHLKQSAIKSAAIIEVIAEGLGNPGIKPELPNVLA